MKKTFKTVAAIALSATMAFASYVPTFATTPVEGTGTGAVYAFAVEQYVVPTTLAFALNPQGLGVVPRADAEAIHDQVIARPVGMINKSTRDKVISIELELSTTATEDSKLTFVDSEDDVDGDTDEFNIYLAVTPAASAVTKLGDGSTAIDKDTADAALADVEMTAAEGKDVVLATGTNDLAFKLGKATYTLKDDEEIVLGTDNDNDVKDKFELTALGGVSAFTLTGALNENAYWEKNTEKIKIDLTYEIKETSDEDVVITGTHAMIATTSAPSAVATQAVLETGKPAVIAVNLGTGDKAAEGVVSFTNVGLGNDWIAARAATYADGVITITDAKSVNDIIAAENADLRKFTIKFDDDAETTVTVTLTAKE